MKEENYFIRCLIFMMLLLLSSFLVFDSPSEQQRAGNFVDDPLITSKERSLLGAGDFLRSLEIRVESKNGNFRLRDLFDSRRIVDMADEIAKDVNGVNTVKKRSATGGTAFQPQN